MTFSDDSSIWFFLFFNATFTNILNEIKFNTLLFFIYIILRVIFESN